MKRYDIHCHAEDQWTYFVFPSDGSPYQSCSET